MAVMPIVTTIMTTRITIIKTGWKQHQDALKHLRETVFMREQNISASDEWDNRDVDAIHYLAFYQQKPVACARRLDNNKQGKIGRVCVLTDYRRQHIATRLLQFIIADALSEKLASVHLDAQTSVLSLYTALGFQAYGEIFQDAGIPHQGMLLNL